MDKQALLEDVYTESFNDELEKVAGTKESEITKLLAALVGGTGVGGGAGYFLGKRSGRNTSGGFDGVGGGGLAGAGGGTRRFDGSGGGAGNYGTSNQPK